MVDSFTVSSSMLIPSAENAEITPAMLTALWGISHELDRLRIPATVTDAIWLEMPSQRLRDPEGRSDNFWLAKCLDRLNGLKLRGEYRGDPWGAVIVAEWHITKGGTMVRLLIPPAAVAAIRAPKTFAKIEMTAAYRLKGHARRLYAALADKKRLGQPFYSFSLDELRQIFDAAGEYRRWADLRRYVLLPALEEINDYGTVSITMTPEKLGRSIVGVRFDWKWKTLDDARLTDEENDQPIGARHMDRKADAAPPLTDVLDPEVERRAQVEADRAAFRAWVELNPGGNFTAYMAAKGPSQQTYAIEGMDPPDRF